MRDEKRQHISTSTVHSPSSTSQGTDSRLATPELNRGQCHRPRYGLAGEQTTHSQRVIRL
ncbi:hypothetical protein CPAR01_09701 [Colletotrichum paranaense]|uniref:Uncharacterized protein n=3 Tax=Colletotrichum acutatum species complex TaxID=2707335 RepID=A0AAI9UVQ6_9PEZI|nr:uncharacterized protein CPAR01_09701 [Colletotrichum paranaense]XP_060372342.1 uncharacterized protein CTAM01_17088 [Colletotrichum tamarilloi]XP_060394248.1 uncharacterized protein CABS01_02958 [Colletotrichum abscissum]KAI3532708.1 hypothetical protein CSPX01_13311 [Colletotrichum filicis]KAK1464345.1 hypothetical protein CMEL01_13106 [Colletotrichum melonis]KAK1463555.1 hypothetical protein CTAM01_17088 [Colletotrichum tamarilloi]KAK1483222.1 hypothetical protein CABS01_02958 [Colletotr